MVWFKVSIKGNFYCEADNKEEAICKLRSELRYVLRDLKIENTEKEVPPELTFPLGSQAIWSDYFGKQGNQK